MIMKRKRWHSNAGESRRYKSKSPHQGGNLTFNHGKKKNRTPNVWMINTQPMNQKHKIPVETLTKTFHMTGSPKVSLQSLSIGIRNKMDGKKI